MTSPAPPSSCVFCQIVHSVGARTSSLALTSLEPDVYVFLATRSHIAILDHQPLVSSLSHILLIPRTHAVRLSDVPDYELPDLGPILKLLGRAICDCFAVDDYNVVQNNGPAAGQLVPHVHFHIVARPSTYLAAAAAPAPSGSVTAAAAAPATLRDRTRYSSTIFARGERTDLDPSCAEQSSKILRQYLDEHLPLWLRPKL
ncbi:HIT-like domain-containing protein [Myxozyma melibiosi]|uniref:HIT-like domain-containing protein n=1 Tax=Myxozyma melibiosi TaxID=54550 RepID=A0ABR1F1C4_9ASCO